ncbi:MAG: dihydrolipoamide acetyltransferase family protein [Pseudomonadota bacterium]
MPNLPIKLPDVGEGVTEAELVAWHVEIGDLVREDDVIAEVMTDKATVEIPSLYEGKIVALGGEIGEVLAIGADLVQIETDADVASTSAPQQAPEPAKPEPVVDDAAPPAVRTKPTSAPLRPHRSQEAPALASPAVRARVRDAGLDLQHIQGTGPAGRITNADVDTFLANDGAPTARSTTTRRTGTEEIKVIGLRRKIAERMTDANARIPHITVVEEVDVTALEDLRAKMNATRGDKPKLTVFPLVSAALCRALTDHPEMNAHFDDEGGVIHRHAPVHIGMATATEAGLVVPVLRHAEALGLFDCAGEIARLSTAARNGEATREELAGSTITITSLGPLGAIASTPIINPPEVAILGINKMETRPHWDGQGFVPRLKMNLSASFDHRVIDGWNAAVFVQKLKTLLETPALIFVDG